MVSPSRSRKIAPSILAADFAHLADDVEAVTPVCDLLHVDVMDGHFVPNISIGPAVVSSLRPVTELYLDCHLMIENPGDFLDQFAKAGADSCTVHVELGDPRPHFDRMRAHGMRVGLVLNPETPLDAVVPYLSEIDILLFMSVHPGFGGQAFLPEVLDKVRAARAIVDERGLPVELEIDGGINLETAPLAAAAGADILVAGSAVFGTPDAAAAARAIRTAAWGP
jgi:ribulose-phosphate 3-epimerase